MPLGKARRTDLRDRAGGVIYRQQYVRCGKATCKKCPPAGPGHGPYWMLLWLSSPDWAPDQEHRRDCGRLSYVMNRLPPPTRWRALERQRCVGAQLLRV